MSDITIKKVSGCSTDTSLQTVVFNSCYTWSQTYLFQNADIVTITNFCSLDFDMKTPVGGMPIPELRDTCNILVKAEGNQLGIAISFTVKCESGTGIVTAGGGRSGTGYAAILTVQEQLDFWLNTFQPNSIEDSYVITVDGITRFGVVRGITLTKSATTPVTYNARLDFLAGNVVAGEA